MSDLPPLVHESTSHAPDRDFSPYCSFCAITKTYGPISPVSSPDTAASRLDPEKLDPPSFVLYSSEHVVAFLDIMPLTKGHVLVAPRKHHVKVGDLSPDEGAEIGRVLPILARSVLKAVLPDIPHEDVDYNVVQNNGCSPRTLPYRPPPALKLQVSCPEPDLVIVEEKYPRNPQPAGRQATAILFGRGMREDLDYDDAAVLVESMRAAVREEWQASFGTSGASEGAMTKKSRRLELDGGGNGRRGTWKV